MSGIRIILSERNGIVPRLIKWQTRGRYSHAYIVLGDTAYEARTSGVASFTFVGPRKGESVFIPTRAIDADAMQEAIEFAEEQVGKRYDFSSVIRFVTRSQARRESAGVWFCSELDFAIVQKAGIDLFRDTQPWEVSPSLLSKSPLIQPLDGKP